MKFTCCGNKCSKTVEVKTDDLKLAYKALIKNGWKETSDFKNQLLLFCPDCKNKQPNCLSSNLT